MRILRLSAAVLLMLHPAYSQTATPTPLQCPPCYYNKAPVPGSGENTNPSFPELVIQIDESWNVDNGLNSTPGSTNSRVWNATLGCTGCSVPGATQQWVNTVGTSGFTQPYQFTVNQSNFFGPSTDIYIVRGASNDCAHIENVQNGPPFTIVLPDSALNLSDEDLSHLIAHEIGHALGLANSSPTCPHNASVMRDAANAACAMPTPKGVLANDVDQVNRQFSHRQSCQANVNSPTNNGDGEGGGDPCAGDPCCGDPCCGDPNCGEGGGYCITYTETVCTQTCWVYNVEYDRCTYWHESCETRSWVECY